MYHLFSSHTLIDNISIIIEKKTLVECVTVGLVRTLVFQLMFIATFFYMVISQGHIIKNPSTQRAKSLLEIPSPHCIIISGAPIQNNLKVMYMVM